MQSSYMRASFPEELNVVSQQIEQKGFAVIDARDTERETLLAWGAPFGQIQNHPKAEPDGIVDLITHRSDTKKGQFDRGLASVSSEFLPHTDGAFVDGFWSENGATWRVGPPSFFLIQCVKAAEEGGESLIIDCQAIFDDLQRESPEMLSCLMQPTLSFCGGKDSSLSKPLFERFSLNRFRVRFRSDLVMLEESARSVVFSFFHDYVLNPKYQTVFPLKQGQILIADNFRVLHGRKQIKANGEETHRHVRRLWIWDQEARARYVTLNGKMFSSGAFQDMERYRPLRVGFCETSASFPAIGIREGEI